jgi:DNA-binding winged helix-turn-helix (wHTH) protein
MPDRLETALGGEEIHARLRNTFPGTWPAVSELACTLFGHDHFDRTTWTRLVHRLLTVLGGDYEAFCLLDMDRVRELLESELDAAPTRANKESNNAVDKPAPPSDRSGVNGVEPASGPQDVDRAEPSAVCVEQVLSSSVLVAPDAPDSAVTGPSHEQGEVPPDRLGPAELDDEKPPAPDHLGLLVYERKRLISRVGFAGTPVDLKGSLVCWHVFLTLLAHPDEPCSKGTLIEYVWARGHARDDHPYDGAIYNAISLLKKELRPLGVTIQTAPNAGWWLIDGTDSVDRERKKPPRAQKGGREAGSCPARRKSTPDRASHTRSRASGASRRSS